MKHFRLVIIFISALLATVASDMKDESTFVCNKYCTNETCMTVRCGVGNCTKGVFRKRAGYCGCCNNCIKPLCLGDPCEPLPAHGVPDPVYFCDYGSTCDCKEKICVPCPTCVY